MSGWRISHILRDDLYLLFTKIMDKDTEYVLIGLGFNGYSQLMQDSCVLFLSTPCPLLTLSSPTRPEPRVSVTWDSVHIVLNTGDALKDSKVLTTGRWKSELTSSKLFTKYDVLKIEEIDQKMIVNTKSNVLLAQRDSQNSKLLIESELEVAGVSFISLEDGNLYALLENGHFHSCSISEVKNDSVTSEIVSIGPEVLVSNVTVTKVCCGMNHVLLLSTNHTLFSFGLNSRSQLGHGDIETRTKPTLVTALDGVPLKDIACGHWHSMALSSIGDVYSWGWNKHGQLGHSEDVATVPVPTLVEFESEDVNIVSVGCGSKHSVALSDNGVLYGWGWNGYGQLGKRRAEDPLLVSHHPRVIELLDTLFPLCVYCGYWNTFIFAKK